MAVAIEWLAATAKKSASRNLRLSLTSHTTEIKGGLKLVQEDKLFLMAALMVADELWETRDELRRALRHLADLGAIQPVEAPAPVVRDRPRAASPVRLNAKAVQTA